MNDSKLKQYGFRYFQNNNDKLEDFNPFKKFKIIEHDEDNKPMMDEDGNQQYLEMNERAKAFDDWKEYINKNRKKLKNIEKNPVATDNFLKHLVNERNSYIPELPGNNKEISKNKINKHLAERNLGKKIKGIDWDMLSKQDRKNKLSAVVLLANPIKKQQIINDLIKEYETSHQKQTNLIKKLRKQASQPGFEFLKFN